MKKAWVYKRKNIKGWWLGRRSEKGATRYQYRNGEP